MILRLLEVGIVAWAETVKEVGIAFATGKDPRINSQKYDASNNYGYDEYNSKLNPDVVAARKKKI